MALQTKINFNDDLRICLMQMDVYFVHGKKLTKNLFFNVVCIFCLVMLILLLL